MTMLSGKIDYSYTTGPLLENRKNSGEVHHSSYGMFWCMSATSFYRIFSKEDMREFLFRLAITLHSINLLDNWLINDRLFNYSFKGQHYLMTIQNIINHFGFEAYDTYDNFSNREHFLANVGPD